MNKEKGESMQRIISDYKKFFTAWNKMHHDKFSPFIYSKNLWMYSLEKTESSNVTTSLHKASLRIRRRSCCGLLLNIWCDNVVEPIGLDLALVNKGENAYMTIHVALTADVSLNNKDIEDIWRERLVELAKWFRWSLLWMVLLEVWQKICKIRCSN